MFVFNIPGNSAINELVHGSQLGVQEVEIPQEESIFIQENIFHDIHDNGKQNYSNIIFKGNGFKVTCYKILYKDIVDLLIHVHTHVCLLNNSNPDQHPFYHIFGDDKDIFVPR